MKKLLIATAVSAVLSTTALAGTENMFYVKANVGGIILNKAKDKFTGLKMKGKTAVDFDLGVGYYVMDNTRVDLTFVTPVNPEMKKTANGTTAKHKGTIYALMANGYVDLFDISVAKVFIGAGVGWSQVKEKITVTTPLGSGSASSKKKNNAAYQLTLGTAAEVAPGVNAEFAYRWIDFGKTKAKKGNEASGTTAYKGHNLLLGIRFDI